MKIKLFLMVIKCKFLNTFVFMKNFIVSFLQLFLINIILSAQSFRVNKVEPPNWWVNHPYNKIQLMIYGENLLKSKIISLNKDIIIEKITRQSSNYLLLSIVINKEADAKKYQFLISDSNFCDTINFPVNKRKFTSNSPKGFNQKDVIYLIFPDRFVNGDSSNDFLFNDKEEFEFGSLNGRHGGDIAGMINKLDYLKDLGITTIWSTPMLENNMYMSYHGYAATDLYKIDPRFGSNDLYFDFVKESHERGLKVIMDHVSNHIGINHIWCKIPPTESCFNGDINEHLSSNHNKIAFLDPYADMETKLQNEQGWFTNYMPDLNQKDPLLAKYLIQNTIWWIESSGIDGIREDTYPYNNQEFMSDWAKTILSIYPNFNIVGEVWKGESAFLAKYQTKSLFPREFDSNLPVVTDFALRDMLVGYLSGDKNLYDIYQLLAQDFIYSNPNNLLVFLDNHDVDRAMFAANSNLNKFKIALTLILTTRGIPQLFYGTEIGLKGGGHHGLIREPFPGGFEKNGKNAFNPEGRDSIEINIFNFVQKLLLLRKNYQILNEGNFLHYPPNNNLYVYKKILEDKEILIALNDDENEREISLAKYLVKNNSSIIKLTDLLNDNIHFANYESSIKLNKNSVSIFLIN